MNIFNTIASYVLAPFIWLGSLFAPTPVPVAVVAPVVMEQSKPLGATNAIPSVIAFYEDNLISAITSSATSMTLTRGTDKVGTSLASSTYAFVIDVGSAQEEMVVADCTGTTCTNMTRGLSPITGTTTVASLQFPHRRGASVKITDGPQLLILSRIINGVQTIPNKLSYTSAPTFLNNTEIVSKGYVDALAFGSLPVTVTSGGTGLTTVPQYGLLSGNGTGSLIATTSPTVGWITATSTTATSTFAGRIGVTGTTTLATTTITSLTINGVAPLLANGDGSQLTGIPVKANTSGVSSGPTTSSTQVITHGLGRTPVVIRLWGMGSQVGNASSAVHGSSWGTFTSSGNRSVYVRGDTAAGGSSDAIDSTTFAIWLDAGTSSGSTGTGVVQNVGATTFDIVWTITGSLNPTRFLWEAQ